MLAYLQGQPLLRFKGIAGKVFMTIISSPLVPWLLRSGSSGSTLVLTSGTLKGFIDVERNVVLPQGSASI
jgi:hypothetical protein